MPKKKMGYLLAGGLTAPSGSSSIWQAEGGGGRNMKMGENEWDHGAQVEARGTVEEKILLCAMTQNALWETMHISNVDRIILWK